MSTAQAKILPSSSLWVVAAEQSGVLRLGAELGAVGLPNSVTTDLELALDAHPEVVVVDPSGWEPACRRILETERDLEQPPPAILFCAPDADVLHFAGPAFSHVSSTHHVREVAAAVAQARRAFREFSSYWPVSLDDLLRPDLQRLKKIITRRTGTEVRDDREATFVQAVRQRMLARLTPRVRDYADLLERSRGAHSEVELLLQLLVVGETYFWRYSGQFHSLQSVLVPDLITQRSRGERLLRLWSAGCSTGEEVYSLGMACLEVLPRDWQLEIWGTDVDRQALDYARRGVYGDRSLRNLPGALQEKYLTDTGAGFAVNEELKRNVRFQTLNLGAGEAEKWVAKTGPFDAVFCRNVLIYFSHADVERLVGVFEETLSSGGGLFLGASETIHAPRCGLEAVRAKGSFFFRKRASGVEKRSTPIRRTVPKDPLHSEIDDLYQRGMARVENEDFEGAGSLFRKIVQLRPDDARGHTGLGLLLANQGRETEAAEHLARAALNNPQLPETTYLLGLLEERSGNDAVALHHYEAVLARDPDFFMAHINRAWIFKRFGRRERFLDELYSALAILKSKTVVERWATGGLGREALVDLVADSIRQEEQQG